MIHPFVMNRGLSKTSAASWTATHCWESKSTQRQRPQKIIPTNRLGSMNREVEPYLKSLAIQGVHQIKCWIFNCDGNAMIHPLVMVQGLSKIFVDLWTTIPYWEYYSRNESKLALASSVLTLLLPGNQYTEQLIFLYILL